jgi:enoyl-[acyl-carrier-protein] reductase (NADH)
VGKVIIKIKLTNLFDLVVQHRELSKAKLFFDLPDLPGISFLNQTTMSLLAGKIGLVVGVANKRSIAWAIAQAWHKAGATLAFTYQGERLKENVEELAGTFGPDTLLLPCDVTRDEEIVRALAAVREKFGKLHLLLHSVAFARARRWKELF